MTELNEMNEATESESNCSGIGSTESIRAKCWYECADVVIDLNNVVAVSTWCYLVSSDIPRGIRFTLANKQTIDTKAIDIYLVNSYLQNAKEALMNT